MNEKEILKKSFDQLIKVKVEGVGVIIKKETEKSEKKEEKKS